MSSPGSMDAWHRLKAGMGAMEKKKPRDSDAWFQGVIQSFTRWRIDCINSKGTVSTEKKQYHETMRILLLADRAAMGEQLDAGEQALTSSQEPHFSRLVSFIKDPAQKSHRKRGKGLSSGAKPDKKLSRSQIIKNALDYGIIRAGWEPKFALEVLRESGILKLPEPTFVRCDKFTSKEVNPRRDEKDLQLVAKLLSNYRKAHKIISLASIKKRLSKQRNQTKA